MTDSNSGNESASPPASTPIAIFRPKVDGDNAKDYILLAASSASPPTLEVGPLPHPIADSLWALRIDPANLPPHLRLPASQIHVIISTNSGLRHAQSYYDTLLSPLLSYLSIQHTTHVTSSPASIRELTAKIISNDLENLIVLLSGDTGITEYLNALPAASPKTTLCILPLGTANAFSSAHNLTLKSLLHGKPTVFPTYTATFSPGSRENGVPVSESLSTSIRGCVVASYGFHASIVGGAETPEYRAHGISKFRLVAEAVMKGEFMGGAGNGFQPYNATVTGIAAANGTKHSYLMLALVDRMEPTFVISPKSRDGQVWALYTGDIGGEELIKTVIEGAYAGGTHVQKKDIVGYEHSKGFRIDKMSDSEPWKRWICCDGRFVEVPSGGWVEIKVGDTETEGFYALA
ncbi:hypothetical protein DRE_01101 [Drechslerella stenobrocha 248]|uniref:DAGKc domain-containing protein n=1 Tax=Drechslerella stenobrocha 248 TaxID=1043628 RepID=W7I689_9PEZI|nr:hypothetical protein DRE_01101 [Drechslerella stenobrocha 248]